MKYFIILGFLLLNILSQELNTNINTNTNTKTKFINLNYEYNEEDEKNCHFVNLTSSNFDALVQNGVKNRWLISFYAEKCSFCKQTKSMINKLIDEGKIKNDKLKFGKVDLNTYNIRLQVRFNITRIPYTILVDNNEMYEMKFLPIEENVIKFLESESLEEYNEFKTAFPQNSFFAKFIFDLVLLAFSDGSNKINRFLKNKNYNFEMTPLLLFVSCVVIGVPIFTFLFIYILDCFFPYKKNEDVIIINKKENKEEKKEENNKDDINKKDENKKIKKE